MKFQLSKISLVLVLLLGVVGALYFLLPGKKKIDFNAQVKPIFNKKCISCHGGVKQQSNFSLLFREEALLKAKSGKYAIVPGDAGSSEMIRRIKAKDPEDRMPYKHEALSAEEVAILEQWINEGANWGTHWAYVPVKQPSVPTATDEWIKNNVDKYIFDQLKEAHLQPSKMADKATLLRRVSLDLTGLPPDEQVAQRYLNNNSDDAYNRLVDDLLASKAYGERWTSLWLDLARYADSKGYESDQGRTIWKYRDWLINAFNADKPYNQFLTEQLAGDLLPNPDDATYIATAFHRNSLTNDEGGTDNDEFRTAAVMDRVNTTWSALMGTTFNCVQCHSHPYDPFKHEEYYQFMAFFNNSRDEDTEADYPLLRQYTNSKDSSRFETLMNWLHQHVSPAEAQEQYTFLKTWQPTVNALRCDQFVNAAMTGWLTEIRNYGSCRLKDIVLDDCTELTLQFLSMHNTGQLEIYIDSLQSKPYAIIKPWATTKGWDFVSIPFGPVAGKHDLYLKYVNKALKPDFENGLLLQWFRFAKPFPGKDKPGYAGAKLLFDSLMHSNPSTTPIMMENPSSMQRASYVFERGNWMVPGKAVAPGVPHVLNPMPAGAANNRLGLAMWLTDPKNPLVARTMVNRLWEQLFGTGLAETLEDLGTQGIPPTHQALLDYLAWQFVQDDHWSIKKILKEMVSSATYRQQSITNETASAKDPGNKLYAWFPRVRLSAEQLRDQGLQVSNLLSRKMYGVPVMPFQPDGIWHNPYNDAKWTMSAGEDMYRRAVYTYWKRTSPYPSMITFDAAQRTTCVTRRIRTNTPLQALTALNDSAYLVMARGLARRMQQLGANNLQQQISHGYEVMMFKKISEAKLTALKDLYNTSFSKYKTDLQAAQELLGEKDEPANAQTAALVVVANAMLNTDEWVTKN